MYFFHRNKNVKWGVILGLGYTAQLSWYLGAKPIPVLPVSTVPPSWRVLGEDAPESNLSSAHVLKRVKK